MIGIIAGTGALPLEACSNLIKQNKAFFVITLFPENNLQPLQEAVGTHGEIIVQSAYKPSFVLDALKQRGATHVLLIGKVDKRALLKKIKLDWLGIKILASLLYKNDIAIMERILSEFTVQGIEVLKQDSILTSLFVKPGVICGSITPELEREVMFGINLAKNISSLDIGQTVLVKDLMVVAVEAIEGTDECIQRGIQLGKEQLVICKAAQPHQNKKYDLPTLGPATLAQLKPGQVKAIAWDAEHTMIVQKNIFIRQAELLGIVLIAI